MNPTDELFPTRASLLSRLKDWDDHESWKAFFNAYWRLIYNAARTAGLTDAEAQDVVQETVLSVAKGIAGLQYDKTRGSFKTWLLQITRWRVVDQFRKRQRDIDHFLHETSPATGTEALEKLPDPVGLDSVWDREWETNLLEVAIERVKKKVDPKQYQVFDLVVGKKWPVSKVAKLLGINSGRVYLARHRVNNLVKKELTRLRDKPY